jgi:hypothetical protein
MRKITITRIVRTSGYPLVKLPEFRDNRTYILFTAAHNALFSSPAEKTKKTNAQIAPDLRRESSSGKIISRFSRNNSIGTIHSVLLPPHQQSLNSA